MRKWFGLAVVALLVGGGAVAWLGDIDPDVNLLSASEVWADVLRDADQLGLRLTRMSDAKEMDFGNRLAAQFVPSGASYPTEEAYIAAVGSALVPHLRRQGIRYRFHVIESPEENAFAIPGGHVFVFTGLLSDVHSEAELAYILGHEMSHVDLRHAAELYQNAAVLERVHAPKVAMVPELVRRAMARGYSKFQELEADAQGVRLCAQAGYDPEAGLQLFQRIQPGPARARAANPVQEVVGAAGEQVQTYFDTHPASDERLRRLTELARRNRKRLGGRPVYEGIQNYQQRIPRSAQEFSAELKKG